MERVFLTVLSEKGIAWAIVVVLAIALWLMYKATVPRSVYDNERSRGDRHDATLGEMQRSLELLLELVKRALP
jgi:hypothetical protein